MNAIRFSQRQRTQNAAVKSAIRSARQTLEKLERAENLYQINLIRSFPIKSSIVRHGVLAGQIPLIGY